MPKSDIALCRKGLSFATDLRLLARASAPEPWVEDMVQRMASRIQNAYAMSLELKAEKVITLMKTEDAGESVSVQDIVDRFHWPQPRVHEVFDFLLREERPRIDRVKHQGPRGGRPQWRYRLRTR